MHNESQILNQLSKDAIELFSCLKNDSFLTRDKLREKTKWEWDQYINAEAELSGLELIEIKRGPGGGIKKRIISDKDVKGLTVNEQLIYDVLPKDGTPKSTTALHRELISLSHEDFQKAKDSLVQQGFIIAPENSRSIRINPQYIDFTQPEIKEDKKAKQKEADLYDNFGKILVRWAIQEQKYSQEEIILEKTAFKGRKNTGGKWTRPDYTLVAVVAYTYLPGKFIDILTFEVKTSTNWNIESVYEAASHSRGASQSYLAIHEFNQDDDLSGRIINECRRFNVGLMSFADSDDSLKIHFEPETSPLNPESANSFIEKVLSSESRESLQEIVHPRS